MCGYEVPPKPKPDNPKITPSSVWAMSSLAAQLVLQCKYDSALHGFGVDC